ncbi:P-loop containing nucleoside triphosphate hydrolase protein [Piedraia hortae CBS 480.64]|uniref:P-loop containing nucleoside triphosphate hydrolase protein n=1 Tax=Piedraia hortae CBS 480.64 TaxID=1314780 RepID=A0A6A7BZK1_9PEZI|nr:P-loop containing nucleoside triphosphate hydrolase protein [Piedraia hortae CBS 480.64]
MSSEGDAPSESGSNESEDSEESDGEENGEALDHDGKVLKAYRKLYSKRVDLVGDYAGDEAFLIEGDSMLLRCFSDPLLDFSQGFQLLHAVYLVEHFLQNLIKRKCNFDLAFFECNRDLCVPDSAEEADVPKYLFARSAIIQHLRVHLPSSTYGVHVYEFTTYDEPRFRKHLAEHAPYFIMMHDGATSKQKYDAYEPSAKEISHRVRLRQAILSFAEAGYNVALVNGLSWVDTKVMTMVLETSHRLPFVTTLQAPGKLHTADVSSELVTLSSDLTERQKLAVLAVSQILRNGDSSISIERLQELSFALLKHVALLRHLSLTARRLPNVDAPEATKFLRRLVEVADAILRSSAWHRDGLCDVADAVDGRLFLLVATTEVDLSPEAQKTLNSLLEAVEILCKTELSPRKSLSSAKVEQVSDPKNEEHTAVLPFSNAVFDKHLESIHLAVDDTVGDKLSGTSHRIFRELTHWHSVKRPIVVKAPPTAESKKAEFWAAKRNQMFMADMQKYAASLTNAVGKSLEPETIIVGASNAALRVKVDGKKSVPESPADSEASDIGNKKKPKKAGGKTAQKNAGKQAMLEKIAADKAKKDEATNHKLVNAWHLVCKNIEAIKEFRLRYQKAKEYRASLKRDMREAVEAEVNLYRLNCVVKYWIDVCRKEVKQQKLEVAALVWSLCQEVAASKGLTKTVAGCVELTVKTLGLPAIFIPEAKVERKLPFTFPLPTSVQSLGVQMPSTDFQLTYAGPYLERSFDSQPDPRVDFNPDGWQRKVLDCIDADQSVFVVAPTSAGKTFISFYAMRKVLEADNEGVLVYVAPTKALVNQIAAEIQARYTKSFQYGGKSVWGIHTRDYRINNPTGCQVLVTVPHVLQIMLLAPSNANSWSTRIKRIIFDEVHSIGQTVDGVIWEQLLLMAPCPIIALSATVGNPTEFGEWLTDTQRAIGVELVTVQHPHRYSDLRKYNYVPPKQFEFRGLPERSSFGTLGLDGLTGFDHIHPVAALVDRPRGMPDDFGLEPRDSYELWKAMNKYQKGSYTVPDNLSPKKALPSGILRKADVLKWEADLRTLLGKWMSDAASPYDAVVRELEGSFRRSKREELQQTRSGEGGQLQVIDNAEDTSKTTLPLLCRLYAHEALPAIIFNFDRSGCERVCQEVVQQLEDSELTQRKSGPSWQNTLERWEEYKKLKKKNESRKISSKKSKNQDNDPMSKMDQDRDEADIGSSQWDNFDPNEPQPGYHFADYTKVQRSELDIYIGQLGKRNVPEWLIKSIKRGVGVHHAGMNRKYRQVVEILFRKGFLRVVIATGTLALGINMPCKTVVFGGDNVFLTALNYRQCAGRAGRRGFDLLGNVVFQGVSEQKVCRLISSRLPSLNGHFPITTSLVLRLFALLSESKGSRHAINTINALLSQPRLYMGGSSFKDQTMHHLRFSIEYLRRQHLLSAKGDPLNFAGLVSHLYFTENSAFAFHALMREGFFHELCSQINSQEKQTLETLQLVMSHLFGRIYCRQSSEEHLAKVIKPSSSIVILPPMPEKAAAILKNHNKQTLNVYETYVQTFIQQHVNEPDDTLPLSSLKVGGKTTGAGSLQPSQIRSPFVSLSGRGDDFINIHDLCSTTRKGVFLEEAVIPHVDLYPGESDKPLNAYLLDFYKHGDVRTIASANKIRSGDIWFLLNDYSLVLATIITSLANFMKLRDSADMDMLDVMGEMDIHNESQENSAASDENLTAASEASGPTSVADSAVSLPDRAKTAPKRKAKNTEDWEAVADMEEQSVKRDEWHAENARRLERETAEALDSGVNVSGEGLKDVLKAFQKLHAEFNVKFRAMWA